MKHEPIMPACEPIAVSVMICAHTLDRWDDLTRAGDIRRNRTPAFPTKGVAE
jgi:hypothetical protein